MSYLVYATQWTKAENIAIYLYMEMYPNEKTINLAMKLKESQFIASRRSYDAIEQHIHQLKKLNYKLYIPDPVHEFNNK